MKYSMMIRRATAIAALAAALSPAVTLAQLRSDTTSIVVQAGAAAGDSAMTSSPGVSTDSAAMPVPRVASPIFTGRDLALATGFTAAAVALLPADRAITNWMRSDRNLGNDALRGAMAGAEWGVEKGAVVAAAGLWSTGLVTRNRAIAGVGAHTLLSVGVTHQVTQVLKGVFGRSRPYVSGDSMSTDWRWGSGFGDSDRRSFPSGHTSTAFAFATAMSTEISHAWPRAGRIATPVLYAGATGAAIARIYHDQHWASDVTLGAAVGILTTRATLRYLHGHPGNVVDMLLLNTRIVPGNGGATVAASIPLP